ncbi:hypothetical protein [Neolewinella agarilytica]|uniref:Uncharacterized protein n=1 Tax=Neolewinella agarilytica TaxID=478744 RepID=A0A1H9G4U0_9BACT|nr:hypothetical protein [Neolewinella agarilytica]SEQ44778.1 hypothetical protein SAMN05444359_11028 [Neolewinella agarilytica]
MLLLPITLFATSVAIFFRPVTRILRADYDVTNPFMSKMIDDLR